MHTTLTHTKPPAQNKALRDSLYDGELFLFHATEASKDFAQAARQVVAKHLETQDLRGAHEHYTDEELFVRLGRSRREIYLSPEFAGLGDEVMASCGFAPEQIAIDPARLRAVIHDGHKNPRAKAVYGAHRDTWYGHPANLITWWVPLDDLDEEETFCFFPEHFDQRVPNDSEVFDYDDWVSRGWSLKIGWQDRDAGITATYPALQEEGFERGDSIGFSCKQGDNLLFSGTHLHATRPQSLGKIRFSLDWRVVVLPDHEQGLGAPQVDNRSKGSALGDYVHPAQRGW